MPASLPKRPGASRRASPQSAAQPGAGCSQLRSKAGQTSATRSALQPGKSLHGAATQRERARDIVGEAFGEDATTAGAAASGRIGSTLAGVVGVAGAGATSGVLEQAARVAAAAATSVPRMAPAGRPAPWKAMVMWVILLEALGALALLVLIVWWTMFAGRRRGERRDD